MKLYSNCIKGLIDRTFALCLFIVLLPIFLVVCLLLKLKTGEVFFTQARPGKNEKILKIYKFKTMSDLKDSQGNLLPDEQRTTKIGQFLRKTSLDELPQLINVIKGELSLIGPRPLLVEYLDLYDETQRKRHNVKPGITGWAQVNGRNNTTWEKRLANDVWYTENISFALDVKILFMTFLKVIKSDGVYQSNGQTMEKFKGSKND
ncbi:bacterial sugar transferase [Bacteriovorax sp. BSW11_IV]|uniref:sugar transferase n=1 Tax=Bacteriovorax sp. BSW11_IV TaxID=1353529 RepID=UPI00038A09F1|nr:sugar transferase [Bacteriovorax sp. BSW11_IV]EQC45934.1 bacterial sugar transferase [Bacteriovorax sp. BSW11_IV]